VQTLQDYVKGLIKPEKILLVEDDPDLAGLIAKLVEDFNCEITIARSVAEARARVSEHPFSFYLIDQRLPDGTGLQIFEEISKSIEAAPVCVISGFLNDEVMEAFRKVGFCVFLRKSGTTITSSLRSILLTFGLKLKSRPAVLHTTAPFPVKVKD